MKIPLWVPQGRAGIQPNINLNYDSRRDNGLLGMGWDLAAASSIVRVSRDVLYDGIAAPVSFTTSDPFELDGVRLILVNGVHGQDGAEYRTHVDGLTKVVLNSPDAQGPLSFTAYTRDGQILTYGPSDESRVTGNRYSVAVPATGLNSQPGWTIQDDLNNIATPTTPVRYGWLLKRVRDRVGNTMEYNWSDFASQGPPDANGGLPSVKVLSEILYTGRQSKARRTARKALRRVAFTYDERDDQSEHYVSGFRSWQIARLRRVDAYAPVGENSSLVRSYTFEFDIRSSGRSLLSSIGLFGSDPNQATPITVQNFEYTDNPPTFTDIDTGITDIRAAPAGRSIAPGRIYVVDIDGDGCDDIFYPSATNIGFYAFRLSRLDASGNPNFGPEIQTNIPLSKRPERPIPLDIDARGRTGLFCFDDSSPLGNAYNYYAPVGPGLNSTLVKTAEFDVDYAEVADFDGDGRMDLLTTSNVQGGQLTFVWSWAINQGGSFGPSTQLQWVTPDDHLLLDINGDGASELLTSLGQLGGPGTLGLWMSSIQLGRSNAPTFETTSLLTGQRYLFADLTGDGLPDAVWEGLTQADPPSVVRNCGNGYFAPMPQPFIYGYYPDGTGGPVKRSIDYDLDGKDEIIIRYNSAYTNNPVLVVKWNGTSFSSPIFLPIGSTCFDPDEVEVFEVLDVNGNGLDDVAMCNNGSLHLYVRIGTKPDLLTKSIDGFGAVTTISYKPVSDPSVYDRAPAAVPYPARQNVPKFWVVSEHSLDNGNGGASHFEHHYGDSRTDLRRRSQVAFSSYTCRHAETGEEYEAHFDLSDRGLAGLFALAGKPVLEKTKVPNPTGTFHVVEKTTSYEIHFTSPAGSFFSYVSQQIVKEGIVDSGGLFTGISSYTDTQQFDDFGNCSARSRTWADGRSTTVSRTFDNRVADWLIGLQTYEEITDTTAKGVSAVRKSAQVFDAFGFLTETIKEPGSYSGGNWQPLPAQPDGVQTLYSRIKRNADGVTESSVDSISLGPDPSDRTYRYDYDPDEGIFVTKLTNPMGQISTHEWSAALGYPTGIIDPNGLTTTFKYDAFGRLIKRVAPGGIVDSAGYSGAQGSPMIQTLMRDGGAVRKTVFDALGRIKTESFWQRDDGKEVRQDTEYDDLGRMNGKSLPYFPSTPKSWFRARFDLLDRMVVLFMPDGTTWSYDYGDAKAPPFEPYQLHKMSITDPKGFVRDIYYDDAKRPIRFNEIDSTATIQGRVDYGPFDTTLAFGIGATNGQVLTYDRLGRPIGLQDPNRGSRTLSYSAFGELASTGDTLATAQYTRDKLGRIISIGLPAGSATFTWDTASIGQLATSQNIDGIGIKFIYDTQGRLKLKRFLTSEGNFVVGYGYDAVGRLASITYPKTFAGPVRAVYNYGNYGQITSVDEAGSGTKLWSLVSCDASGRFGKWQLGNGVTEELIQNPSRPGYLSMSRAWLGGKKVQQLAFGFDAAGNLAARADQISKTNETFTFDGPGRLTGWNYQGTSGSGTVTFGYDGRWNLRRRSGKQIEHFNPMIGNGGPDAAADTSFGKFTYDSKGNRISGPAGNISYNWINLPENASHNNVAYDFEYEPLATRVIKRRALPKHVTVTIGSLFEGREGGGHQARFRVPLPGPTSAEIVVSKTGAVPPPRTTYYLHTDNIGSVRTISDDSGGLERLAYDPFGRRNHPEVPDKTGTPPTSGITRGFAGQDHDDELGLINMRGRIYDPTLCRFISCDAEMGELTRARGLNPYAYAFNNPGTYRDPTGYDPEAPLCAPDDYVPDEGEDAVYCSEIGASYQPSTHAATGSDNGVDPDGTQTVTVTASGQETTFDFTQGITFSFEDQAPAPLPAATANPDPEDRTITPDFGPTETVDNYLSGVFGILGTNFTPNVGIQITRLFARNIGTMGKGIPITILEPVIEGTKLNWLERNFQLAGRVSNLGKVLTVAGGVASAAGVLLSGWDMREAARRGDGWGITQAGFDMGFSAMGVVPLIFVDIALVGGASMAVAAFGMASGAYSLTRALDQTFGITDLMVGVNMEPHYTPD